MVVRASMVWMGWRPAGLSMHLTLSTSARLLKSRMMTDIYLTSWSFQVWVGECLFWYQPTQVVPDKGQLLNRLLVDAAKHPRLVIRKLWVWTVAAECCTVCVCVCMCRQWNPAARVVSSSDPAGEVPSADRAAGSTAAARVGSA